MSTIINCTCRFNNTKAKLSFCRITFCMLNWMSRKEVTVNQSETNVTAGRWTSTVTLCINLAKTCKAKKLPALLMQSHIYISPPSECLHISGSSEWSLVYFMPVIWASGPLSWLNTDKHTNSMERHAGARRRDGWLQNICTGGFVMDEWSNRNEQRTAGPAAGKQHPRWRRPLARGKVNEHGWDTHKTGHGGSYESFRLW